MGSQASKSQPASPTKVVTKEGEEIKEHAQEQVHQQVQEHKEVAKDQAKEVAKDVKEVVKGKEDATLFKGIKISTYEPVYEVEKTYEDIRYGKVALVVEKETKLKMIKKEITVNTESAYEKELKLNQERIAHAHEALVKTYGYNSKKESSFCATAFRVNVFIEYLEKTFQDISKAAKKEGKTVSDAEILLVAENLIFGLADFQAHKINHGDIKSENIFATATGYKLVDPTLTKDNNTLVAAIAGKQPNLAPEVLALVPKKDLKATYDKTKADVFALGITLLKAATGEKTKALYNYKEGKINEAVLAERLNKVKANYPAFTYELIASMLTIDAAARPDFIQLESRLAPFRVLIRSRRALVQLPKVEVFDDELLARATLQIKKSQQLRYAIETERRSQGLPPVGSLPVIDATPRAI